MAWENTSSFFQKASCEQSWINKNGDKCKGKGHEFYHENSYEEISFFVPFHSFKRSKERIVEHTDTILYVWEEFIKSTAYLDFVTEGTHFCLHIDQFVIPMMCTEMSEKKVRFHLNTTDRSDERTRQFVNYDGDILIECKLHAGTVSFVPLSEGEEIKKAI
jgi:hypothetical protein